MRIPARRTRQPGMLLLTGAAPDQTPRHRTHRLRSVRRGVIIALWTIPAAATQAVMLLLPGRGKIMFARLYWASLCRMLGLHVRVIGTPARTLL